MTGNDGHNLKILPFVLLYLYAVFTLVFRKEKPAGI
jgi:hypothetical protein